MTVYNHHPEINIKLLRDVFGHPYMGVPADTTNVRYAYAYIRIGSTQSEDDLYAIKAQIEAINAKALVENIHIPGDMVYCDIGSGNTLDRPALAALREDYLSPDRMADIVILEAEYRLYRSVSSQSLELTKEMKQAGITAIFCSQPSNRVQHMVVASVRDLGQHGGFRPQIRRVKKKPGTA
jgi:hypothetical protein